MVLMELKFVSCVDMKIYYNDHYLGWLASIRTRVFSAYLEMLRIPFVCVRMCKASIILLSYPTPVQFFSLSGFEYELNDYPTETQPTVFKWWINSSAIYQLLFDMIR